MVLIPEFRRRFAVVEWRVLDAADYGVPQRRHRVILVCGPVAIRWPEPTHSREELVRAKWIDGDYWREHGISPVGEPSREERRVLARLQQGSLFGEGRTLARWRTVRDVLGLESWATETRFSGGKRPKEPRSSDEPSCQPVAGGHAYGGLLAIAVLRLDDASTTIRAQASVDASGHQGGHAAPLIAVSRPELLDSPSPTVTGTEEKGTRASEASSWTMHGGPDRASDAVFLATGIRRLRPGECSRLQSWPELGEWGKGGDSPLSAARTKSAAYRVVGNACCPPMIEAIGRSVIEADQQLKQLAEAAK